ncbi:hypothetical protein HRbin29_01039 [bacterium HR29]|jgi:hypothetical protein|nr:hypothetical protein HRbin29_01039 [bacterium HR29]
MTDCSEVELALEELALGTLSGDLASVLRRHLAECPRHPQLRELALAAAALAFEPEPVPPRPELRERVLAATAAQLPARRALPRRRALWAAAAAILLLVTTGLAVAWRSLAEERPEPLLGTATDQTRGVSVTIRGGRDSVSVSVAGLEPPPPGMAYQLWLVQGDAWVPLTTFLPDPQGRWKFVLPRSFHPGDRLCITVEGAAGSAWPTSAPLIFVTIGE